MFRKKPKEEKGGEPGPGEAPKQEPAAEPKPEEGQKQEPAKSAEEGGDDVGSIKNMSGMDAGAEAGPEKAAEPAEGKPAGKPGTGRSGNAGEPEEEEALPRKKGKGESESKKLRKQLETQKESLRSLEREKGEAIKRSEELAGLIEEISSEAAEDAAKPKTRQKEAQEMPDIEPKLKEMQDRMEAQVNQLKEAIQAIAGKDEEGKKGEQEVAETMKRMFDKRLRELTDKFDEARDAASAAKEAAPAAEVSGGLMAMGGGMELKNEVDKLKKSLKDLATLLDAFKEEAENRFMGIDRELETVEKLPDLEDKMQQFEKKLGSENVLKLRTLISSVDDIKQEVIPLAVKRQVEQQLDPFVKRLKASDDFAEKLAAKLAAVIGDMEDARKDAKTLSRHEDRISGIDDSLAEFRKLMAEVKASMKETEKAQARALEDRIKETFPKLAEPELIAIRKEFAGKFAFMDSRLHSADALLSELRKEIAEACAIKGEIGGLEDGIKRLDDEREKIMSRIESLKREDAELEDKIEELETPKEVITELDNKTKDVLDIREFFVRRADGLEERINELDKRAVPVKTLADRCDTLARGVKELSESLARLEAKSESEKKELHDIIKQHAEEKRQLEEKLKEQRIRISTLIKEFR